MKTHELRNLLKSFASKIDKKKGIKRSRIINKWNAVNDKLNEIIDIEKVTQFKIDGKSEYLPMAKIETFKYSDNTFGLRLCCNTGHEGFAEPFGYNVYRENNIAIEVGKDRIKEWILNRIKESNNKSNLAEFNKILNGLNIKEKLIQEKLF